MSNALRSRLRSISLLVVFVGLAGLTAWVAHVWVTDHLRVLRAFYPAQATLAHLSIRCSEGAPQWMRELADFGIEHQGSLAAQLAFREPSGRLHHCEHGWKGRMLTSEPVDVNTRFRYASLTKLLTADAILAKVNEGELSLADRLPDLVHEWRAAVDPRAGHITLEHLLRHRAGFDRHRTPDPMALHNVRPWCPGDLTQVAQLKLDFEPGARTAYANLGYCLLGVVLERKSAQPFREHMERFHRLSDAGLRFVDGPFLADEVAYDFRNSGFYDDSYASHFDFAALSSSAGLSGSAVGLAQLLGRAAGRRPLSVLSSIDVGCDALAFYRCRSLGAVVSRWRGSPWVLYSHGGTLYGMSAQAVMDERGGVLVWLGNGMPRRQDAATQAFLNKVHQIYVRQRSAELPS